MIPLVPVLFSAWLSAYCIESSVYRALNIKPIAGLVPSPILVPNDPLGPFFVGLHTIVWTLFTLFQIRSIHFENKTKPKDVMVILPLVSGVLHILETLGVDQISALRLQVEGYNVVFLGVLYTYYLLSTIFTIGRDGRQKVTKFHKEE